MPLPTADQLAAFLADALGASAYPPDERGGVYRAGDGGAVACLGFVLEPWPGLAAWAAEARLDALFLHRPWRLASGALADRVAVLWSHLPFDERLTTGDNEPLARALGFRTRETIGSRDGRPLGMIGDVAGEPARAAADRVSRTFGGHETLLLPSPTVVVHRVAVVGAMTTALVHEAAARGVGLYVTGQLRKPALAAVAMQDIAVLALGHGRVERWGLAALGEMVHARWPALRVRLGTSD